MKPTLPLFLLAFTLPVHAALIMPVQNSSTVVISATAGYTSSTGRVNVAFSNSAPPNVSLSDYISLPVPGSPVATSLASQNATIGASHIEAQGGVGTSAGPAPEDLIFSSYASTASALSLFDLVFQIAEPTFYHLTGSLGRSPFSGEQSGLTLSLLGGPSILTQQLGDGPFYDSQRDFDLTGLLATGNYHLTALIQSGSSGARSDYESGSASFSFIVAFTPATASSIVTQPRSRTNVVGSSLMMSVASNGTEPLTFQWYKEGAAIPGATGRTYVLTNVQSTTAGSYHVRVTDLGGFSLSSNVHVTVVPVAMPEVIGGPVINPANGREYYLLAQSTWVEAEAKAQALGGHLATIRTAREQEWVFTNFSTWGGLQRNLWIGLYDADPVTNASNRIDRQGEFVWASGESVNYTNWNVTEPNNYRELGEFYVHTLSPSEVTGAGTWNDTWDSEVNGGPIHGVVEVDASDVTVVYLSDKREVDAFATANYRINQEPRESLAFISETNFSSVPFAPFVDFNSTISLGATAAAYPFGPRAVGSGVGGQTSNLRPNGFRADVRAQSEIHVGGELTPSDQAAGEASAASRLGISFALLNRHDFGVAGEIFARSSPPNSTLLSSFVIESANLGVVYSVSSEPPQHETFEYAESFFQWSNSNSLPAGIYRVSAIATSHVGPVSRYANHLKQDGSLSFTSGLTATPLTSNAILFNNYSPTRWSPVFGPEPGNPRLFKQGNPTNGLPAGTQTYGGLPLVGTNWIVELWGVVGAGQPATALQFQAKTRIQALTEAEKSYWGMFLAGTVELSGIPEDQPATFQVRVYDDRRGAVASWTEVQTDSAVMRGWSEILTVPASPVRTLQGLQSFNVYAPANPAVTIANQPVQQIAPLGGTAVFTVTANGNPSPSYQWLFNGQALPGANVSSLIVTNVETNNLGGYSVIAWNDYSAATSSVAMLLMSPSIRSPFLGDTVIWGRSATLSVSAVGSGDLSYQWFRDGEPILWETNSTLVFSAIQLSDAGLYSSVVSSALGSVTNTPAQLVVNPANISLAMYAGITIDGVPGFTYGIQYTTDLRDTNAWTTVTNLTLGVPVETWVDLGSVGRPRRYYRVVAQ